jgi:hypothetical protein
MGLIPPTVSSREDEGTGDLSTLKRTGAIGVVLNTQFVHEE